MFSSRCRFRYCYAALASIVNFLKQDDGEPASFSDSVEFSKSNWREHMKKVKQINLLQTKERLKQQKTISHLVQIQSEAEKRQG